LLLFLLRLSSTSYLDIVGDILALDCRDSPRWIIPITRRATLRALFGREEGRCRLAASDHEVDGCNRREQHWREKC
ncbi:hypothetical protein PENTCL1PPCAC_27642, partial [Pristionchus entomophagus]